MRYIGVRQTGDAVVLDVDNPSEEVVLSGGANKMITGWIYNPSSTTPLPLNFYLTSRESQEFNIFPGQKLYLKNFPCDRLQFSISESVKLAIFEYDLLLFEMDTDQEVVEFLKYSSFRYDDMTEKELAKYDGEYASQGGFPFFIQSPIKGEISIQKITNRPQPYPTGTENIIFTGQITEINDDPPSESNPGNLLDQLWRYIIGQTGNALPQLGKETEVVSRYLNSALIGKRNYFYLAYTITNGYSPANGGLYIKYRCFPRTPLEDLIIE